MSDVQDKGSKSEESGAKGGVGEPSFRAGSAELTDYPRTVVRAIIRAEASFICNVPADAEPTGSLYLSVLLFESFVAGGCPVSALHLAPIFAAIIVQYSKH